MTRNKKIKNDEILNELFRKAFKESTPSGDWDQLYENASINEFGQKVIPFMDYYCSSEKLEEIFNSTMEKYKIKDKYLLRAFSVSFYLGCSPTSNKDSIKNI